MPTDHKIKVGDKVFTLRSEATREELNTYLRTPEGQDVLRQKLAALEGGGDQGGVQAPPPPVEEEQPFGYEDGHYLSNIQKIATDLFQGLPEGIRPENPEAAGAAAAGSPLAHITAGAGQLASQLERGTEQLTGRQLTPWGVKVLDEEGVNGLKVAEAYSRQKWAEFDDEQVGWEDAGEALWMLGMLINPAAKPTQALTGGAKALQMAKNVSGSLGGAALFTGLVHGLKGVVEGESRLEEGGKAGAATVAGGLLGKGIVWAVGPTATLLGLGKLFNANPRFLANGLARSWTKYLWKNADSPAGAKTPFDRSLDTHVEDLARTAERTATRSAVQLEAAAAREAANEAKATAAAAKEFTESEASRMSWEGWLDLVKGPKLASGKRSMAAGKSVQSPKVAKEVEALRGAGITPDFDEAAEANRAVATLLEGTMRPMPGGKPGVMFDIQQAFARYRELKRVPGFRSVYGTIKDGKWVPGPVARKIEEFLEDQLTMSRADRMLPEGFVPASGVLRAGAENVVEHAKRVGHQQGVASRARAAKAEAEKPVAQPSMFARAKGMTTAQIIEEDGIDAVLQDGGEALVEGGWETVWDTWEEIRKRYQL